MNNKYLRYALGFLLLFLIISSFNFSKILLFILSVFFIIITMIEYRAILKNKEIYPHKFLPEIFGVICTYIFVFIHDLKDHIFITPVLICFFILSFMLTIIRNKKPYIMTSLSTIAAMLFILFGLYIIKISYFFAHYKTYSLVLIYFSAVLAGDFLASIIGPRIKPVYIAPEISPNKTLAGCIANLISTCMVCLLFKFSCGFRIYHCLIIGTVISVFSQFGDLIFSSIKRDMGIKHSGTLFYNYGGLLDRMDSFIISAPAFYYCLYLFFLI